jgi:hypothetical protein
MAVAWNVIASCCGLDTERCAEAHGLPILDMIEEAAVRHRKPKASIGATVPTVVNMHPDLVIGEQARPICCSIGELPQFHLRIGLG